MARRLESVSYTHLPNDLLRELDQMEFHVYETARTIRAKHRPLVIITSNNEKDLPDAFLRRCFFHYIEFPDSETLRQIVAVHYPNVDQDILNSAMQSFFELREMPGLKTVSYTHLDVYKRQTSYLSTGYQTSPDISSSG